MSRWVIYRVTRHGTQFEEVERFLTRAAAKRRLPDVPRMIDEQLVLRPSWWSPVPR